MKLKKYLKVEGNIECVTGLRIGGSKDDLEIGGNDNPIIRDPLTDLPYIPGSSLKGKMRSLLEYHDQEANINSGKPCNCTKCKVCRYFGSLGDRNNKGGTLTKFLFRDCRLTEESINVLRDAQEEKGINYAEIKRENWIDRKTGKAGQGGLRTQERVPAGVSFKFELSIRVFDEDNEEDMLEFLRTGLRLLEQDYLGGSGTRGYGQVRFVDLKLDGKEFPIR